MAVLGDGDGAATLSPAVRRAVLEHGVDPSTIKGTGKDGRLTKEDVLARGESQGRRARRLAKARPAPAAAPAASGERSEERVKMTRMRQTIAKRLKGAQDNAALLTTFNDVDMTAVIEARDAYKDLFAKKHDIRLGFMGFFAKAACLALEGRALGQCLYRGRRNRLSRLCRYFGRGQRAQRAGRAGDPRCRMPRASRGSSRTSPISARRPRTAR